MLTEKSHIKITKIARPVENRTERIDRKARETSEVLNWEGLKLLVNLIDINNLKITIQQFLLMYLIMKTGLSS